MKRVIVISAHPDDEVLGAGGTLLRHVQQGDKVYWLIATNVSVEQGFSEERVKTRQEEIKKVEKLLGIEETFHLNYTPMRLSSGDLYEIIPRISKVFLDVKPEIIYCLNRSDAHSDHRVTFDAVMACTKSFRYPFIKQVLLYECISETEFAPALHEKAFIPNYFVDISIFLKEKLKAMEIYKSEIGDHPFPRSLKNIEALATYRGASVGVKFAEAFQLIKFIEK